MAYVLTLKIGEAFFIDDVQFEVASILSSKSFVLRCCADDRLIAMADGQHQAIAPNASASVGNAGSISRAQVTIQAPKSVLIDPAVSYSRARRPLTEIHAFPLGRSLRPS